MPLLFGGERLKSSESFDPGENDARRFVAGEVGVGGGELSSGMVEGLVASDVFGLLVGKDSM